MCLEKLISREKKLLARKLDSEILAELRKPKEDSEIINKIEIPIIPRIGGLKLAGQAFADLLMAFEFLHNFGETLGFGKNETTKWWERNVITCFCNYCRHGLATNTPVTAQCYQSRECSRS